jgi:hypothetical protein
MRNEELGMSNDFIEQRIIEAVQGLVTGRVNNILRHGTVSLNVTGGYFSEYEIQRGNVTVAQ